MSDRCPDHCRNGWLFLPSNFGSIKERCPVCAEAADREVEEKDNHIRALEAENARLLCDRDGWAARSREQFDRIGKALEPFRLKRPSGEPDLSDASEVERLIARATRLADENARLREPLAEALEELDARMHDYRMNHEHEDVARLQDILTRLRAAL